jgi:acetyl-CoA carboxylase carboxyl transferase subunit alpha
MLQNSFYAILSPEGFASILWKDAKKSGQAAKVMQLLPEQLLAQGIIEKIVPEKQPATLIETLREQLLAEIARLQQLTPTELLVQRQARFRKF